MRLGELHVDALQTLINSSARESQLLFYFYNIVKLNSVWIAVVIERKWLTVAVVQVMATILEPSLLFLLLFLQERTNSVGIVRHKVDNR